MSHVMLICRVAVVSLLACAPFVARAQQEPAPAAHPQVAPSAQSAPRREDGQEARRESERGARGERRESERGRPADSQTKQTLALPDRTLSFAATAGSVRLRDESGEAQADIGYVYYRLDAADAKTRPLVFLFNGGPGAGSAWLHLGAAGPWRVAMAGPSGEAASPSDAPTLLPNAETWLDFADLVFIDPVGTGWSRFAGKDERVRKSFYSVDGDARSIARAIRLIVRKHERIASPKFIVGESYGGIRGPKVAHELATREGVGVRGLALVSPLFDMRDFGGSSLLQYAYSLPSMAAVARAAKGQVTRADLADVESYASGAMLADLFAGQADVAATGRLSARVAQATGLDPVETRRLGGRVSTMEFRRAFDRARGLVTGRYDGSTRGFDPFPDSALFRFPDPSSEPLIAPLTSAITQLATQRLGWKPEGLYRLLSEGVSREWDWGRSVNPPESLTQLREVLALDRRFKLLVMHGLFDLATPYFASQAHLAQLPDFGRARVRFVVHPGGHMFYSRDDARAALRADMEALTK